MQAETLQSLSSGFTCTNVKCMEMTPVKCIVYKVIKLSLKSGNHSCFVSQGNVSSQVNITEAG